MKECGNKKGKDFPGLGGPSHREGGEIRAGCSASSFPIEFWGGAKPKGDGNKELASKIPGPSHSLEVAGRFSGISEA